MNHIPTARSLAIQTAPPLDALVIGAGQAGLAAAWHLQRAGLSFAVLEASDAVGGSWNLYYDSLTLFSPRRFSSLPGMAFPKGADEYPRKGDVIDYLTTYANRFAFPIQAGRKVISAHRADGQFRVETDSRESFQAKNLIVAAGGFATPNWPSIPGEQAFQGAVLHSYAYRNAADFENKRVVVVGGGNSAVQIAVELAEQATVTLATRDPIKYLPSRLLGLDVHYWLWLTRLERTRLFDDEGTPVLDDGTYRAAIEAHRPRHRPMFVRFENGGVVWPDGEHEHVDAVIYATGYRPTVTFLADLPDALDASGRPDQRDGIANRVPGLYFVGIPKQRNFASATLRGVGPDSAYVVNHLKRHMAASAASPA